ncbi:hypothetical protein FE810_14730 [Thalassotalea litorea]|uniref:Uncharacterized protein n=2 Tax=Thalassotalea litorea TaxID=2020715 RepID=A0A5R9IFV7_9GAMM|nr:hypothetical protein FE810_14730 [Thalassotalea litorea]
MVSGVIFGGLLSTCVVAAEAPNAEERNKIEMLLAEAAGKMIYLTKQCDKPVDPEKFKELSKLKAFSEGYQSIEGISWEHVRDEANQKYGELNAEGPDGEFCEQYEKDIQNAYPFLKPM